MISAGRRLNLTEWNQTLLDWYFPLTGPRPVFLYASASELQRINNDRDLGLDDPAGDLARAVNLFDQYPATVSREWARQGAKAEGAPPFLAHLAVTVLVVDDQIDQGSTAFYEPLSRLIGHSRRLSQDEYQWSYHSWWVMFAKWLHDDLDGARGTPTWRKIPLKGPRSIIGHPYTQVVFSRQDRGILDDFIEAAVEQPTEVLAIADEPEAAAHLFREFARWARNARGISPRLFTLVTSNRTSDHESLGFLLLDRIADAKQRPDQASNALAALTVVPTIDEWDRRLHLSVISPAGASPGSPVVVRAEGLPQLELDEAGAPRHLSLEVTADRLAERWSLPASLTGRDLAFRPTDAFVLVRRDWDEWVAVKDPMPEEDVYVLAPAHLRETLKGRYDRLDERQFRDVPDGWVVMGPARQRGRSRVETPLAAPRFRGGLALRVTGHTYLTGGAPILCLPSQLPTFTIDNNEVTASDGLFDLNSLELTAGEHVVTCGPFTDRLWLIDAREIPKVEPIVGLTAATTLVQVTDPTRRLVSGLGPIPREHLVQELYECPLSDTMTLLGSPLRAAPVNVHMSQWAHDLAFAHNVFEPKLHSSYGNRRPLKQPWWIVGDIHTKPWVALMPWHGEADHGEEPDAELWKAVVGAVGPSPQLVLNGTQTEESVLDCWRDYLGEERSP